MRLNIFAISLCLLFASVSHGAQREYIKEYTYEASEADSKLSARRISLEQIKILLLEEIGIKVRSEINIVKDSSGNSLGRHTISAITSGVASTKIIDEKWDGRAYYIKASISVDPEAVRESIKTLEEDRGNINKLNMYGESVEKKYAENKKIAAKLQTTTDTIEKERLSSAYKNNINQIEAYDKKLASTLSCVFPDSPNVIAPGWICGELIAGTKISAVGNSLPNSNAKTMRSQAYKSARDNLNNKIFNYASSFYVPGKKRFNPVELRQHVDSTRPGNIRVYKTITSPKNHLYIVIGVPVKDFNKYMETLYFALR